MSLATEIAGKLNYLNTQDNVAANATLPYSGYTQVSRKLDNFVFQASSSFLNKVADKNRYVKFGEKVVDTYGPELVANGDFSVGTTRWALSSTVDTSLSTAKITTTGIGGIYQSIPTIAGHYYYVTANFISETVDTVLRLNPYNNTSATGAIDIQPIDGRFAYGIVATGSFMMVYIRLSTAGTAEVDNISVREIQTAQFTVPNVTEIITNGSNTTSVSVNAGDYVVDGRKELVINGTFDTDISGWTAYLGGTLTYNNGKAHLVSTSSNSRFSRQFTTVIGVRYQAKLEYENSTSNTTYLRVGGSSDLNTVIQTVTSTNTADTLTVTFTATSTTTYIGGILLGVSEADFGNISVKRVSDTFRAKQDAPIGTALTNTTYFEDRTQIGVTNQQLAYHAYNVLINSYEGIKVETLFSDVSKDDLLDNPTWLARNGFTKVSEFLYSKSNYLVVPVGIWQSLNKGAYHPFLNSRGVQYRRKTNVANYTWYMDSSLYYPIISDVKDCFLNNWDWYALIGSAVGTTQLTAHPQGKYYDICYPDQFIDVREYAKVLNKYEVDLIRADKEENGVEEVVSTTIAFTANATNYEYLGGSYSRFNFPVGTIGSTAVINQDGRTKNTVISKMITSGGIYDVVEIFPNQSGADRVYINLRYRSLGTPVLTGITTSYTSTKPILSSNTKLSTDLIGI